VSNLIRSPNQLRERAAKLDLLARVPDRATGDDIYNAAETIRDCAVDIERLTRKSPPGCTCRLIEDDDRSYVVPDPTCRDHSWQLKEVKRIQDACAQRVAALEDSRLWRLIEAALHGSIATGATPRQVAERAWEIARAALRTTPTP